MLRNVFIKHKQPLIFPKLTQNLNKRLVTTLTPIKVTELLRKNEINLPKSILPSYIKSLECNQLGSNSPIEDRIRVAYLKLPNSKEPTLICGLFDGHGGGTTADVISRRLFNYIAVSLYPKSQKHTLQISNNNEEFKKLLVDVYNSPSPKHDPSQIQPNELILLSNFREQLPNNDETVSKKYCSPDIVSNLKASFTQCDDDLAKEIQYNLMVKSWSEQTQSVLHYYLSAAVSGCCALVMVIHEGIAYMASTGDCRGVLGVVENVKKAEQQQSSTPSGTRKFQAIELNEEHNCDNINEIRRLASSHPQSEQNTMVKHNRLLGHLMPFRAFGDYCYKWPVETIHACGITRAFGSGVIPTHYATPPYLITEPDVKRINLFEKTSENKENEQEKTEERCIIMATDGLWELFESSRDVIETIMDHSANEKLLPEDYDENTATHALRSALRSGSQQDVGLDGDELRRLYHIRLESTLTLPQSVVRNFRDDISIAVLKLAN